MTQEIQRPLPPKTIIGYADMEAEVVEDHGGATITVTCEGEKQRWYWTMDGETCRVLSLAGENADRQPLPKGSVISYNGMEGVVVADNGGDTLTVETEGEESEWKWSFDGHSCHVLSVPGKHAYRQPLPKGSVISYNGMEGVVVADNGGDTLKVEVEGEVSEWKWSFDGQTCVVVKVAS